MFKLQRLKNTKGVIIEEKGTRMDEDGEDGNGLEMAKFFKMQKR